MKYRVREAASPEDLRAALALRQRVFRPDALHADADHDAFDARCRHVLVEDAADGSLRATCRFMVIAEGQKLSLSYAAQTYDLEQLSAHGGPFLELGRFCVAPGADDPDLLRLIWGAIAAVVDREAVQMLFGCASFPGTDPARYAAAFAQLRARHLAPAAWAPGVKAAEVYPFAAAALPAVDAKLALAQMPPLLRSYLMLGGRVSDHAVIDRDLGTLHVLTGLDVAQVPAARARSLRRTAQMMAE